MTSELTSRTQRIQAGEAQLHRQDPVLGKLIVLQGTIMHAPRDDYFFSLCRSIVGQQVSVAAAASIFAKFQAATSLKPEQVATMSDDELRALGLSRQKAGYLRDLARHFVDDPAVFNHLEKLDDAGVIQELTAVKGIGTWTAQMFLMFTLTRLDVFAPDDVGLQRAIQKLYGLDKIPPRKELEKFAERWRPYRTIASWHLWHSLDNAPI